MLRSRSSGLDLLSLPLSPRLYLCLSLPADAAGFLSGVFRALSFPGKAHQAGLRPLPRAPGPSCASCPPAPGLIMLKVRSPPHPEGRIASCSHTQLRSHASGPPATKGSHSGRPVAHSHFCHEVMCQVPDKLLQLTWGWGRAGRAWRHSLPTPPRVKPRPREPARTQGAGRPAALAARPCAACLPPKQAGICTGALWALRHLGAAGRGKAGPLRPPWVCAHHACPHDLGPA